jgi:arginase
MGNGSNAARVGLIGVPTSAGAFAPGQEQAPSALRDAGLLDALRAAGVHIQDYGDGEPWPWRPDPERRRAQNLEVVVEVVSETAQRVTRSAATGELTVVLGGDCTVGIGTVAGHVASGERVGLVYLDAHADLNVPESVTEGALDWMGLAHMLGEHGAIPDLAAAGPRNPLLDPDQVVLLGWDPAQATQFELDAIERNALAVIPASEVSANAAEAAMKARARAEDGCDRLLVHFDVDVIDFTDLPLSENWGRNVGVAYRDAMRALRVLLASPKLGGLTITELNPDHAAASDGAIERFTRDLAAGFTSRSDG